jgi:hypothetical protein
MGCVVLPKAHRKAYAILAMLLVCMTTIMVIKCQVHTTDSAHATPSGHQHSHDASGHTAGTIPCVIAVLPLGVALGVFTYMWFHIPLRMLYSTSPVFPLFIPPRNATRASRTSSRQSVFCVAALR